MSSGCFIVYKNKNDKWDIVCSPKPNISEADIPNDQKQLYLEVEEASSIIKTLSKTEDNVKDRYIEKLLKLAQVGLVPENPLTELAHNSLETLKEDICIQEGGRIKNQYMKELGYWAIGAIMVSTFIRLILNNMEIYDLDKYIYGFIGAMIGTWISFGARKLTLSFRELSIIESDRLSPMLRLLFIGVCSCIILLFINNDVVQIYLGGINTNKINNSVELQILIGIIVGLIEYKIGIGIHNKANDILRL